MLVFSMRSPTSFELHRRHRDRDDISPQVLRELSIVSLRSHVHFVRNFRLGDHRYDHVVGRKLHIYGVHKLYSKISQYGI